MSDSVRLHRRQPTRLPCPWDSPGKNTGVGCHFLLQCMKVKSESEGTQSCPTLSDPMDCSLPGSSIMGFSRQEYWSGVPLPSLESRSVLSNSLQLHGLYNPWNYPGQNTGVGSCSLIQGIFPTQGSNPGLPHCRQILYKLSHKDTGVGSLSLLQGIFLTQESNQGLLYCRQIVYQLSYQGGPIAMET